MKKPVLLLLIVCVLAAAAAGLHLLRGRVSPHGADVLAGGGYSVFAGTSAALPLRFEYPSGWRMKQEAGRIDRYAQVLVEGPRNSSGTLNPMLIVRTAPRSSAGGKHSDAQHLMTDFLSHIYKDPKITMRRPYELAGAKGFETEYTHTVPPLRKPGLKGHAINMRTRHLFLEKGDLLIEVVLFADRSGFDACRPALDRLLSSFSFTSA